LLQNSCPNIILLQKMGVQWVISELNSKSWY